MQYKTSPIALFVISFAAFASGVALAGYLLSTAGFRLSPLLLVSLALVLCVVVGLPLLRGVRLGFERFDVVMVLAVVLVVLKLAPFFSGRPVGGSVDLAHYFFATDWVSARGDLGFVDYANASGYYYLWHTWEGWWWYYGFEFLASLFVPVFGVLGGMSVVVVLSCVVSLLSTGLIARRVAGELGGVLVSLQLLLFPAFFYPAFQDFFANLLGVAIDLALVYVCLDLRREVLPLVFLLTAGGFLVHIHATLLLLVPVILYRLLCDYSRGRLVEFAGFVAVVLSGFITAYALNGAAFDWYLFGATKFIVAGSGIRSAYEPALFNAGDFFSHWLFLIAGAAGFILLLAHRRSYRNWLFPALWFSLFAAAILFFIFEGKAHWANRMAFFFVYPLAVVCGVFYLWCFEFAGVRFGVARRAMVPLAVFMLAVSAASPVGHVDVSPAVFDAGMRLSSLDENATVGILQIPERTPEPNKFFISAFSRHKVAWPRVEPEFPLSYEVISNFTYTNDYIPEWVGGVPEDYSTFENYDAPGYLLVLFAGARDNIYYVFDLNNLSSNTCWNVVSNREACSGVVDLAGGDAALCVSGCFEPEDVGRWTGERTVVVIPTFTRKNLSVTVRAGAFRPPGVEPAQVEVYFNGVLPGGFTTHDGYVNFTAQVDESYVTAPFSTLTIHTTTWVPDEWIHNGDKRRLGVRVKSIGVR